MHVSSHIALLLQLGLKQRVLHNTDPNVHLNSLLLQFG